MKYTEVLESLKGLDKTAKGIGAFAANLEAKLMGAKKAVKGSGREAAAKGFENDTRGFIMRLLGFPPGIYDTHIGNSGGYGFTRNFNTWRDAQKRFGLKTALSSKKLSKAISRIKDPTERRYLRTGALPGLSEIKTGIAGGSAALGLASLLYANSRGANE